MATMPRRSSSCGRRWTPRPMIRTCSSCGSTCPSRQTSPPTLRAPTWQLASYRAPASPWLSLGRTPLNGVRIPRGQFRVRISKAGFQPIEGSGSAPGLRYRLDPVDAVPPGMVRVTGGRDPVRFGLRRRPRRLLDRSIRGHQPAVQGVRRSRRLQPARLLAGAIRRRQSIRAVGRGRREIS